MSPADARRQPFDALPHASWPDIAAVLSGVWPKAAAEHDLRWYAAEHAIRSAKLPSVRDLAARWGWTRSRAYDLLSNEAAWRDASRPWSWREADPSGDADIRTPAGQSPDTIRTASGQPERLEAGNPEQSGQHPDTGRTVAGHDPDSRAFLVGSPNTQHPAPGDQPQGVEAPPEREIPNPQKWATLFPTAPPEAPAEPKPDPLVDAWTALIAWTPRPASWSFSAERRTKLKSLVKQHGIEAIYTVARWMTSEHERARFLRERGDMSTLLRPGNFSTYLAMAETGIVTAPRPAAPPRPNAPTPFVSIADMIASRQSTQPPTRTGVVIDIEEPN